MKTLKLVPIYPNENFPKWEHAENQLNGLINNGWTIEHVSPVPNSNGEILVMLSKNELQMV